jgi:hypothetical protein
MSKEEMGKAKGTSARTLNRLQAAAGGGGGAPRPMGMDRRDVDSGGGDMAPSA